MASRFDKLYDLLESNNPSIRSAAVVQIAQVSENNNVKLAVLLNKLLPYVKHKTWAVRISAAETISKIGKITKPWIPNRSKLIYDENTITGYELISLNSLNLSKILDLGTRLYSTNEVDLDNGGTVIINKEEINNHLGMDIADNIIDDIIVETDYQHAPKMKRKIVSINDAVLSLSNVNTVRSNRKRQRSNDEECHLPKKVGKLEESCENEGYNWEWAEFCKDLLFDLWNPRWEIRHGCATALRELIRTQGSVIVCSNWHCGIFTDFNEAHENYLEDIAARLLCTLALDQVSDFVSDEMVAPVRESCAQVLGILSTFLSIVAIEKISEHLLTLLDWPNRQPAEWTVCHGGLLGLKYVLASAKPELLSSVLLPKVYIHITRFLHGRYHDHYDNADEDLRCAAAAALIPLFSSNSSEIKIQSIIDVEALVSNLWIVLDPKSDYNSAGAILNLLDRLYQTGDISVDKLYSTYLDKLHWCYFNYSESVRLNAINTFRALLKHHISELNDLSPSLICQILGQLYQRILIDDSEEVIEKAEDTWLWLVSEVFHTEKLAMSCLERLDVWLCCAMQPSRIAYLVPDMIQLPPTLSTSISVQQNTLPNTTEFYIAGRQSFLAEGDSNVRQNSVLRARISACRALAKLIQKLCIDGSNTLPNHIFVNVLCQVHLKDRIALQRFVAGLIIAYSCCDTYWLSDHKNISMQIRDCLLNSLKEPLYYQEILPMFKQMLRACRDLLLKYTTQNVGPLPAGINTTTTLNLNQCQALVSSELQSQLSAEDDTVFSFAKTSVSACWQYHQELCRLVEVALARSILSWGWITEKLTPLIRPMMDTIRLDSRISLQKEAAIGLATLIIDKGFQYSVPITKLMRNISNAYSEAIENICSIPESTEIVIIYKLEQLGKDSFPYQENVSEDTDSESDCMIKLRGTKMVYSEICNLFLTRIRNDDERNYNEKFDVLFNVLYNEPMMYLNDYKKENLYKLLSTLRAMEICLEKLKEEFTLLGKDLVKLVDCLFCHGLSNENFYLRHWCARVIAVICMPNNQEENCEISRRIIDEYILGKSIEILSDMKNKYFCIGIIELFYLIMHKGWLKYRLSLISLIIPLILKSLNAPNENIRRVSTLIFSNILTIMPLEQSNSDMTLLTQSRIAERYEKRTFIEGLMRPDSIEQYDVSQFISAELRHYQQLGVNWLYFLNKYGLHGILADDMGLGKTLQTLCIIAGQVNSEGASVGPSLIVCPSTLTIHWDREIKRYVNLNNFSSLIYSGSSEARQNLISTLTNYNVVITSYEVLRNDSDQLIRPGGKDIWNYLVLDEGHFIRNYKSKVSVATKTILARHRLVLTGTPVQNKVSELWSIFDFLMPGLLGNHAGFQRKYGKYLNHGYMSSTRKVDTEEGTMALDLLHKQVLPFLLRRVKEEVLSELPPKIMQDYLCNMTPLQNKLYSFMLEKDNSQLVDLLNITEEKESSEKPVSDYAQDKEISNNSTDERKHIFKTLHYLRQVCNHPCLVLNENHPLYNSFKEELNKNNQQIDDINLSGKLIALRQLILDCGIGNEEIIGLSNDESCSVVSNHRLLIFCQSKLMITLVEKMIQKDIPYASFLRLDGSVNVRDRQSVVDKFNNDPSVDILLLTTTVGGLGLNLNTADTVIFVEHDWNPSKDLQAMDRAHRLGQKRTVNVYRLITNDSIEEKIMNLQHFKMYINNSIVNNSDKKDKLSDNLLDSMIANNPDANVRSSSSNQKSLGGKSIFNNLESIYEAADEYSKEYGIDNFFQKL